MYDVIFYWSLSKKQSNFCPAKKGGAILSRIKYEVQCFSQKQHNFCAWHQGNK